MTRALDVLREELSILKRQVAATEAAIAALSLSTDEPRTTKKKKFGPKHPVSSSLKRKLRRAAKARWAKVKAAGGSHL